MKIVSYARTTCFDPTAENPPQPIAVQTENIREYLRKRHWRLSGRYSDRKNDPAASEGFLKMKQDALNREFDCIIVDSITRFGADVYMSINFLRKTYYPVGMHFAVVEDDFYSGEHTDEEVYAYLDQKRAFIHGRMTIKKMGEASIESYFSCYGFRYSREGHVVEKDEESARIIVEIYNRLKTGELPVSIARDMTRRGIENPTYYYARQLGRRPRTYDTAWSPRSVNTLARNPKYKGEWDFKYDIRKLDIRCGAIVDPELFEEVQEVYRERFTHTQPKARVQPYTNLLWDKETGMKVRYFNCTRTNHHDVRFEYPKEQEVFYERPFMPYEEFHDRVRAQLALEKKAAEKARRLIESEEGIRRKTVEMQKVREPLPGLLQEMFSLESQKMAEYQRLQRGEIKQHTFKIKEREIADKLKKLDDQTERMVEQLSDIEVAYSDKNPWIKAFTSFDISDALVRKKILRLLDKILLFRFETVELVPKENAWKQALPAEWFMEGDDGEDEQKEEFTAG